ncbi:MAG TPA: hypothetical protein VIV40_08650 [Kofleriaceae bacterium]
MVGSARTRDFLGDIRGASFTLLFGKPVTDELGVPMLQFSVEGRGKCTVHRQLGMRSFTLTPDVIRRLFDRFIAEGFTQLVSPTPGATLDDLVYMVTLSNDHGHTRKLGRTLEPHPQFDRLVAALLDDLEQQLATEHRTAVRAWLQPLKPLTRQPYRAETDVGFDELSERTRAFLGDFRRAIIAVTFPGGPTPGSKTTAYALRGTGEVSTLTMWWDFRTEQMQEIRTARVASPAEVEAVFAVCVDAAFTELELPKEIVPDSPNAAVTRILELTNEAGQTHEIRYVGSHDVLDYLSMLVANTAWKPQRRWWQFWR